jgi:hypothetical protein|tara:strand:- start:14571 stop:15356 length:786 start_codon:yes stop_codon:yes gene_type:complete
VSDETPTFLESLPEDMRDNPSLKDFKDTSGLAKAFLDTKGLVGEMSGRVTIPGNDAGADDWNTFYTKIGRPEKAEDYEINLPDLPGQTWSEDAISDFKTNMHKLGMTPTQIQGNLDWYMGGFQKEVENSAAAMAEASGESIKTLRKEWGGEYDSNMGKVDNALKVYFGEEEAEVIRRLSAGQPGLMKSLADIGSSISEDRIPNRTGNGSSAAILNREDALAKIKELQSDPQSAYMDGKHPNHRQAVEEVTDLYRVAYDGQG